MTAPSRRSHVVAFAGGGSGGHLFPGLAILEAMQRRHPEIRGLFLCSDRPIDAEILGAEGADHRPLPARAPSFRPRRFFEFMRSIRRTRRLAGDLLRGESVELVICLGGFVTPPVVAAARAASIPILLVNLDAAPGRANRWVASRVDWLVSAVPTPGHPRFDRDVVGFPLRRAALAPGTARHCRMELELSPDRETLLVVGASQGSARLNRTLPEIAARSPDAFASWQVLHLCGTTSEVARVEGRYREAGVRAMVHPFLRRMGLAWGAATLAVSRAGAGSVAEATANQVPTVFVPYPGHRDQHQLLNVEGLVARGAAVITHETPSDLDFASTLGDSLIRLLVEAAARSALQAALERIPPSNGAEVIAGMALSAMERPPRSSKIADGPSSRP